MSAGRAPGACALGLLLAAAGAPAAAAELVVATWGGAYQKNQEEALFQPWERRTGHRVVVDGSYSGGLAEIKAQVETGTVTWQTLVVESQDALLGCEEGLLEPLDHSGLPPAPDGTPAAEDYIEGGCSSAASAARPTRWCSPTTTSACRTGRRRSGTSTIWRSTPASAGCARRPSAIWRWRWWRTACRGSGCTSCWRPRRASRGRSPGWTPLRGHAVWWESASQPPQLLADGEVVMTTAYNGRIFDAIAAEGKPFRIVWDAQVYGLDYYVIPRGAAQKELAMELIAFATSTEATADLYSRIAYMPMRRSAMERIGGYYRNPELDMRPHMPLAPANAANAVRLDDEFWLDYSTELTERFRAWLIR